MIELLLNPNARNGAGQGDSTGFDEALLRQEYDRERADAAAFMRKSAWVIMGFVTLIVILLTLSGKHHAGRMIGNVLLFGASAAAVLLLRLDRQGAAFNTFVVGNWLAITVLVWFTGGFFSVISGAWVLLIAYAAWLLSPSWQLGLGAATLVTMAAMNYAEQLGWLPAPAPTTPLARGASLMILFALGTALFYSFSVAVRRRLREIAVSRDQIASSAAVRDATQRQLQLVADNVPAMLLHVDSLGRYLWFNRRYAEFYGVALAQVAGKSIVEVVGAENGAQVMALRDRVVASRQSITTEYTRRGTDRRGRVMRSELVPELGPDGEVKGIFNLIQDITETRRRADLMAALAVGTAGATDEQLFCRLAESLATVFGVRFALVTELVDGGAKARALGFWGDGGLLPNMTYALDGTPCRIAVETGVCFVDRDAAQRFAADRALAIKGIESYLGIALQGRDGRSIGVLTIMDVRAMEEDPEREAAMRVFANRAAAELERIRAAEALRRSEETFSSIFHESPLSMVVVGPAGIEQVNAAFERTLGFAREDLIGMRLVQLGIVGAKTSEEMGPLLLSGQAMDDVEIPMRTASAGEVLMRVSGRVRRVGGQERQFWYGVDVTEMRRVQSEVEQLNVSLEHRVEDRTRELAGALESLQQAQEQLVQAEKLASLGSMVAGLAHELNTPIGNGRMAASTLSHEVGVFQEKAKQGLRRADLEKFLGTVATGASLLERNLVRAAELVATFKQVALDGATSQRRSFALAEVSSEVALNLKALLHGAACRLEWTVAPDLRLDSYPGPLGNVLLNLITNAVVHGFAGRAGGSIRVEAAPVGQDRVLIEVRDDGVGIPAENLKRVFDPFFTTMMGRGGTGLGLNIVYNIVTGVLGGSIGVDSRPGAGTTFRVILPLRAPKASGVGIV